MVTIKKRYKILKINTGSGYLTIKGIPVLPGSTINVKLDTTFSGNTKASVDVFDIDGKFVVQGGARDNITFLATRCELEDLDKTQLRKIRREYDKIYNILRGLKVF